jgi:hypothetical protein
LIWAEQFCNLTCAKLTIFFFLFLYFQWQVFFDCNRSFILYPIWFNKNYASTLHLIWR